MSEQRAMQRLCGLMRKAVQDYEMLVPGDRVMVGVSGGKDSVALTVGLALLRQYIGFDYEVVAVTLDPQFRDFLAAFYTEASSGLLLDWIKNKMNQNRETILQDILSIYKISLPAILLEKGIPEKHST